MRFLPSAASAEFAMSCETAACTDTGAPKKYPRLRVIIWESLPDEFEDLLRDFLQSGLVVGLYI